MKGIAAPDPRGTSPWLWLPDALTAAAIIAVVALALLVAACG